jgi:hypothetical protein
MVPKYGSLSFFLFKSTYLLLHIYYVFQYLEFFEHANFMKLPYNEACQILDPKSMKVENIKIQYKIASEIQKLTNIFLTV